MNSELYNSYDDNTQIDRYSVIALQNYLQVLNPSEKEFDKVHDAITLNKPEDEDFSKILSPMYGTYLPSMQPADSIPEYKVEESKENMNLSEMLEKPKKETNKQESLFDKEGE